MGGRRRLAQQGLATGVTDGFTNGGRDTHLYLCLEHCLDCHLRALHATEKPNHRVSAGRVDPPNTIERFSGLHCRGGGMEGSSCSIAKIREKIDYSRI